uniref:Uncharacterized protein n=1 Tax=Rhizophora mucronata TaxID=61149 RepID=A0A2P2NC31_RHIMU
MEVPATFLHNENFSQFSTCIYHIGFLNIALSLACHM